MEAIREEEGRIFNGFRNFVPHDIVDEIFVSRNFGESTYSLPMAFGHFVVGNNIRARE